MIFSNVYLASLFTLPWEPCFKGLKNVTEKNAIKSFSTLSYVIYNENIKIQCLF